MKKLVLTILLTSFFSFVFSQVNHVAVNDIVFAKFGEVKTINPILNDYDPEGKPITIDTVYSNDVEILIHNDSLITFKMPDYNLRWPKIHYILFDTISVINSGAEIYLIPDIIIDTLNCNQIKATVYPTSMQFFDRIFFAHASLSEYKPQFHYPANEETTTFFNYNLWMGGINQNTGELHLAAERYQQVGVDYWPGPLSDDGLAITDSVNAGKWCRTWKVTKKEIEYHLKNYNQSNYIMPEAIASWPAHGDLSIGQAEYLAPFIDVDLNSHYDPENGDYPLIKGDESVFFIFNEHLEHTETEGKAMGIEIHCMAWAYEDQSDHAELNSTIFYSYKFFNRSMITYNDFFIGVQSDFDLGYAFDDYIGSNVQQGYYYVYNGRAIDGNGEPTSYGENPPSQAVCFLGGPYLQNDHIDNPAGGCDESINGAGFGDGIIDNERLGMGHFLFHNNGGNNHMSDPQSANDYYKYLKGVWKDGQTMVYGGNAHPSTGGDSLFPARYMWPGNSDPCHWGTGGLEPSWDSLWTEETTGNPSSDIRGVGSSGPFTFEAGAVQYLDIALVTAPGEQERNSKDLLEDYVASIRTEYLKNPDEFGNQYVGLEEVDQRESLLEIYPNPVNGDFVYFDLPESNSASYKIYNAAGQLVLSGQLTSQKHQDLFVGELESGWYVLEVQAGKNKYRSKLIK